ncbi:hypothetical protein JXO59_14340 [candidate division KSB1 bacterium]|nr:hypothetical protein [candidate division KSB1 bacterium]
MDKTSTAFDRLQHCAEQYRLKHRDYAISEVPGVSWGRAFFHAIGIDPTKRRPSSEALLHRALKGKDLYTVNSLVDVGNWCSLDFLLPICVYDAEKIIGDIHVRIGRTGESYAGINGQEVHLADRYVIADETGPFGSPITDSLRTAVGTGTRRALLMIFAPEYYDAHSLRQNMDIFAARAMDICGGSMVSSGILNVANPVAPL